ncbi:DNA polymerase beta domain protein [Thermosulfidibacter takaii ABI70S6]|uniref:DNA polymerase beta domain protein n=1 Tax=Thermosulfidibacter takaii (strain DSM 17441 / JCM 13301 / NBRC 103674 / ABI70S6) TaxID=1298851 RepID=A0A0S3QU99_THET7|nr:nucleotidyltransferase family protein [Thermosulfidibacter takaii]BAT71904.1 DNA polymerase beta domain protein [Thermosulfidibacter takaii ABI70S6]
MEKVGKVEEIKEKLRELKPVLMQKYGVKEIGIFGSYVKGKVRKGSDLDILVDFYEVPDLLTFVELQDFLTKRLKVQVDLVMKSSLKPYIGKVILQEVVYV